MLMWMSGKGRRTRTDRSGDEFRIIGGRIVSGKNDFYWCFDGRRLILMILMRWSRTRRRRRRSGDEFCVLGVGNVADGFL